MKEETTVMNRMPGKPVPECGFFGTVFAPESSLSLHAKLSTMQINKNTVVSVNYHLTVQDENGKEELVEQTDSSNPFVFLYGAGNLLEEFEKNLSGKNIGDTFDFIIEAGKGYGDWSEDNIVNIPIDAFRDPEGNIDEEMLKVGNTLPMVDNEGNHLQGTVEEVQADVVRMDFNHPLAGQDLHFKGEVLEVRSATEEELSHGHVHGPGGHHH